MNHVSYREERFSVLAYAWLSEVRSVGGNNSKSATIARRALFFSEDCIGGRQQRRVVVVGYPGEKPPDVTEGTTQEKIGRRVAAATCASVSVNGLQLGVPPTENT